MAIDINSINPGRQDNLRHTAEDITVSSQKQAKSDAKDSPETSNAKPSTSVNLSSTGKVLSELESSLKDTPEVDVSRVEAIRAQIAQGDYEINSDNMAQKMLEL